VEAIEDATHDIKRIWLTIVGGDPLFFTASQYARLTFPDAPTRDYSMASEPDERELEIHINQVGPKTCMPMCLLRPEKHRLRRQAGALGVSARSSLAPKLPFLCARLWPL
jgi:hypothetical protein